MSGFERPAPDIEKIAEAWRRWSDGEEQLPGRTMADLKIGGTDRVLETLAERGPESGEPFAAWSLWEKGRVGPGETLSALTDAGFADVVEALTDDP